VLDDADRPLFDDAYVAFDLLAALRRRYEAAAVS